MTPEQTKVIEGIKAYAGNTPRGQIGVLLGLLEQAQSEVDRCLAKLNYIAKLVGHSPFLSSPLENTVEEKNGRA